MGSAILPRLITARAHAQSLITIAHYVIIHPRGSKYTLIHKLAFGPRMGNTASNKAPDAASGAYSPTPREETVYGEYFHPPPSSRYSSSGTYGPSSLGTTSSSVTPPVPPRATGLERRSMTVVAREKPSDSPVRPAWHVVNFCMCCPLVHVCSDHWFY